MIQLLDVTLEVITPEVSLQHARKVASAGTPCWRCVYLAVRDNETETLTPENSTSDRLVIIFECKASFGD